MRFQATVIALGIVAYGCAQQPHEPERVVQPAVREHVLDLQYETVSSPPILELELFWIQYPDLSVQLRLTNYGESTVRVSKFETEHLLPQKIVLMDSDGNEWRLGVCPIAGIKPLCPTIEELNQTIAVERMKSAIISSYGRFDRCLQVVKGCATFAPGEFVWFVDDQIGPGLDGAVRGSAPSVRIRGRGTVPYLATPVHGQ